MSISITEAKTMISEMMDDDDKEYQRLLDECGEALMRYHGLLREQQGDN